MTWRANDRRDIAKILGLPRSQDRPDSRLDTKMNLVLSDDTKYSTNYVLEAQNLIDTILALPDESTIDDYGYKIINIPNQISTTRAENASLVQARQRRSSLVGELVRIIGISPQQQFTLRS